MDGSIYGVIGGIAGAALGITGGIIGTYFSIKNAKSSRERALMIKLSLFFWVIVLISLCFMILLPMPYKFVASTPFAIIIPIFIITGNRKLQAIKYPKNNRRPS